VQEFTLTDEGAGVLIFWRRRHRRATYVGVIVWRGRAVVPTSSLIVSGPCYMTTAPVHVASLDESDLAGGLERAIAAGHPRIRDCEIAARRSEIPEALGLKGWRKIDREAAKYAVYWERDEVAVYVHDPRRPTVDVSCTLRLAADVNTREIARTILEDVANLWADGCETLREPTGPKQKS